MRLILTEEEDEVELPSGSISWLNEGIDLEAMQ
jgi:hypothetical protein